VTTIPSSAGTGDARAPAVPRLLFRRPPNRILAAGDRWSLLVLPALVFVAVLFIYPLGDMVVRSLTEPSVGLGNYERFFGSSVTLRSLAATFRMAAIATLACVVIGYPYAYLMATTSHRWAWVFAAAVIIPSFLSFLVRIFSLQVLLRDTGVINEVLGNLGLISRPLPLIRNEFAVTFGMTSLLLPLFILPAYAVMRRIDPDYVRAAAILGARPLRSFLRVYLPLSLPGVAAGCLLVFVIALGYYITPAILGDGRSLYLSELVVFHTRRLDWGFGSAIAVMLLLASLATLAIASRLVRVRDVFGVSVDR
jgi:ABC-type spermidine/putrescine transport system permease subunit I